MFKIISKDKKTNARVGLLNTKKGVIETPFFMPVATKASVKYISNEDLNEMKAMAIISNSFILHRYYSIINSLYSLIIHVGYYTNIPYIITKVGSYTNK